MLTSALNAGLKALTILTAATFVKASPISSGIEARSVLPLTVNTIYQGAIPTWHENLAVRTNGQLVVTRMDGPIIEQVDPTGAIPPVIINTFSSAYAGCLGITETSTDIFYVVVAAPFDSNFVKTSGNTSVFKIDLTSFKVSSAGAVLTPAVITKVVDLPDAGFLNGMITLNASAGLLLIADSYNGWVYRLNVKTGAYTVVINDAKMKYLPGAITNLGINGIKLRGSYLYFSNTGNPIFSRIPINSVGVPTGASEVVASILQVDDFVFRSDGTAWLAQNQIQSLSVVAGGQAELVAGNNYSTVLAGVTAAQFGRTSATCNILYLTTNGGLAVPVNGSVITGGKIAYIDTSVYTGIGS
ncbi:hypothetical protein B0O99DRAFT_572838 [Bisporella sp. PMI_857]|nr:hypothetical protein B0O99DRAFT_572838 [Bisporella sp. PMI_857]